MASVDVLFVAWNRREFTTASWAWLMAHTNWDHVHKLVVYDDGSEDGTQEFLREATAPGKALAPSGREVPVEFRVSDLRSPPAVMNHYLATSEADMFVKIDNDIAVPGGYLDALLSVMLKNPSLELLGMEAGMIELAGRDGKEWDGTYRYDEATNIGGVGLMRVSAFRKRPAIPSRGRWGFTEWQQRYEVSRGWIVPDLHCPQLDRIPLEPWTRLAKEYVENGWSRPWPPYSGKWMRPYYEWMIETEVAT